VCSRPRPGIAYRPIEDAEPVVVLLACEAARLSHSVTAFMRAAQAVVREPLTAT
jgi:hypothetical protein